MLGSLLRVASTLLRKRVREPEAAEPSTPAKRASTRSSAPADRDKAAARECSYLVSGCGSLTCRAHCGAWPLLPADLVQLLANSLPLADRLALRLACVQYADAVAFCGLRLPIPLPARHMRTLRPLGMRPAVRKLEFVQEGCSRLEKRVLKRLLKALQFGSELGKRRFEVRLVLGAPLSSADLAWLQAAFTGAGLLERCASFEIVCAEAALSSTFRQVDVLKLAVERLGSASKGLCSGAYRNLESLTVMHIMREDDVQDVLAVVGAAHVPSLRSLHLGVAAEPEGGNARPIVVGCRGPHPDLSQLARLGMAPSINLCVNFLRYLSSLPGLTLSESLQRAVDAYLGRRQSLMFVLMFGHHEEEQHGFLAGELMIQFEGEEESDENE